MNIVKWINFIHIYQPANIDPFVVKEATEKSYYRIINALEKYSNVKFSINITGCLILRWEELGYFDILRRINKLINYRQLELFGSAAYHPVLPLIPEKEIIKQIKENEEILKKYFGINLKLSGFFMPEMAYGVKAAKIIKKLGYQYLILGETAYNKNFGKIDFNKVYLDKNSGLKIIFRSNALSRSYVPETIFRIISKEKKYFPIITATDGELYGLRHIDYSGIFEKIISHPIIKTETIKEFIQNKEVVEIIPRESSWESTEKEISENLPYALWYNPKNNLQMELWKLAYLAYFVSEKFNKDTNYYWSRWHLVRGLASCTFWWASGYDFRRVFGPISWGPDEIERGLNEFIRSIRSIDNIKSKKYKIKGEKIYAKISQMLWNEHWRKYWKK